MADAISEELRSFINKHIHSLEQLEILLLLRDHSEKAWDVQSICRQLALQPESVALRLADLHGRGFISREPGEALSYRFGAPSAIIDDLAAAYRAQRVSITTLIFSKPLDNVRSFAAAFKFRKED